MVQSAKILYFSENSQIQNHSNKRGSQRDDCWMKAVLESDGNIAVPVVLLNISNTGIKIRTGYQFNVNETVELVGFDFYKTLPCEVVWVKDDEAGLQFCA